MCSNVTVTLTRRMQFSFKLSVCSRRHRRVRKGPHVLLSVPQQSLKVALQTTPPFVWLNIDRSRPQRVECWLIPFSAPCDLCCDALACPCSDSSLGLYAPLPCQAAERCDVCTACRSVCSSIASDSSIARRRIHRSLCNQRLCMAVCHQGRLSHISLFATGSLGT